MSTSDAGDHPPTQPAFFGPPPRPPKITARGIEDQPDEPERRILLSDPVVVRDLAMLLNVKPFRIVARLMELRQFKRPDETIDFATASFIAGEYGYEAERLFPKSWAAD